MNALKLAWILPALLLIAIPAFGQSQYGEAVLEKGQMTIIRGGQTLKFEQLNEVIPVIEEDLIRVRPSSRAVLRSREKATVTLGSNAVFHVKPFQSRGKTGFLRALFGRFRASVVGLVGGEQFNVKTATATIGVKGTEYTPQVTTRGGTMVLVVHNPVTLTGQRGPEVPIGTGLLSLTVGSNPATPPAQVPQQVADAFAGDNLDSPDPNDPAGGSFAGEQGLIQAGIVTQKDLNQGKGDQAPPPTPPTPPSAPSVNFDPNQASKSVQKGRVPIQFQ